MSAPAPPDGVCPVCHGLGLVRHDLPPGHPDFGRLVPCPAETHTNELQAHLLACSGLKPDERYTLADVLPLGDVTDDLLRLVRQFVEEPRGWLYVWGGYGNAKSLALMATVNEFILRGVPALYVTLADLLALMRETFARPAEGRDTYPARFRRVQEVKLLAIDEFDSSKINETAFASEFRTRLIDHRYRDAVAGQTFTMFAGNDDPASLPGWIYDRVRDGRFVVWRNPAPSVRPAMTW